MGHCYVHFAFVFTLNIKYINYYPACESVKVYLEWVVISWYLIGQVHAEVDKSKIYK